MKADDAIRLAIENETSKLVLMDEAFDKMLDYIENHEEVKTKTSKFKLLKSINARTSQLPIREFIAVAAFVFILVAVPFSINHYNLNKKKVENGLTIDKTTNDIFIRRLENFIEDMNSISIADAANPTSKCETYTDIKEIEAKAPFSFDYPKFIPEGYEIYSTELSINKRNNPGDKAAESVHFLVTYRNSEGKVFNIIQSKYELPEYLQVKSHQPPKGLNCEQITLNGLEGWFQPDSSQLMFWSKDRFYNINAPMGMDKEIQIKIAKSLNAISDPSFWPTEKYESYTAMNEIKEKVPFAIEFPKYIPEGYNLQSSNLDITRNSSGNLYELTLSYNKSIGDGFSVYIFSGIPKPDELLKKFNKTAVGNSEYWIYPSKKSGGTNQIMFWKNNLFYIIFDNDIDTMKKIAESYLSPK